MPGLLSRVVYMRTGQRRGAGALPRKPHLLLFLLALLVAPTAALAEHPHILLVADPEMTSPIFRHSVVLVAPRENGSAVGVILNRPLPLDSIRIYRRGELLQDMGLIHFGGPVNPGLLIFLFRADAMPEGAVNLFADVYFSNDMDLLAEQMLRPREKSGLQLYAGYTGWAPGQLQAEISHGGWSVVRANVELVFETDRDSIWQQLSGKQRDKSI